MEGTCLGCFPAREIGKNAEEGEEEEEEEEHVRYSSLFVYRAILRVDIAYSYNVGIK